MIKELIKITNGQAPTLFIISNDRTLISISLVDKMVDAMKTEKELLSVDAVEVIETFYKHKPIIDDVVRSRYYTFLSRNESLIPSIDLLQQLQNITA